MTATTSTTPIADRPWLRVLQTVASPPVYSRPVEVGAFARVAMLWASGRALNLMILFAWFQISSGSRWSFGPDGYRAGAFLTFLTGWDADRYGTIATEGYPLVLPTDADGTVLPNNWAFLPVFPIIIRVMTEATGLPWRLLAVVLALGAGLLATWLLFLLLRHVTSPDAAWWATALFTIAPTSFVLVVGYSEGLFLALTFGVLLLVVRRRYAWVAPLGVVAAFTRPGALALALALGLVLVARWTLRRDDPFPLADRLLLALGAVATGLAGAAWPIVADTATGVSHAYFRTETGWWVDAVGDFPFVPFTPWFRLADAGLGSAGIVLVLAVVIGFALLLRSRGLLRLGGVVWSYTLSYGLYVLAVFLPQQSLFRILMPLSPVLAHRGIIGTHRRRRALVITCLALQPVAILLLWTIGAP